MPSKNIIKKNLEHLYTKGKEFSIKGKEYIGEYHFNGNIPMTGPYIGYLPSEQLDAYYSSEEIYKYDKLSNSQYNKYIEPVYNPESPTDIDYKNGWYYRYFIFRSNDPSQIYEINKNQYSEIGQSIDSGLYTGFNIKWILNSSIANETNYKTLLDASLKYKVPNLLDIVIIGNNLTMFIPKYIPGKLKF